MADLLVTADYRGHFSHGMNRLDLYINDIQTGAMDAAATPTVLKVIMATIHLISRLMPYNKFIICR